MSALALPLGAQHARKLSAKRCGQQVRVAEGRVGYDVSCRNTTIAREFERQIARWRALAPDAPLERLIEHALTSAAVNVARPAELPRGEALHRAAHPEWSERRVAETALHEAECAARFRARRPRRGIRC